MPSDLILDFVRIKSFVPSTVAVRKTGVQVMAADQSKSSIIYCGTFEAIYDLLALDTWYTVHLVIFSQPTPKFKTTGRHTFGSRFSAQPTWTSDPLYNPRWQSHGSRPLPL